MQRQTAAAVKCVCIWTQELTGDNGHWKWPVVDQRWGNLSGKGGISWFLLIPITSQRGRADKEIQHPPPPCPTEISTQKELHHIYIKTFRVSLKSGSCRWWWPKFSHFHVLHVFHAPSFLGHAEHRCHLTSFLHIEEHQHALTFKDLAGGIKDGRHHSMEKVIEALAFSPLYTSFLLSQRWTGLRLRFDSLSFLFYHIIFLLLK